MPQPMIDGDHLDEIDQTGQGLSRAKERHCRQSVARLRSSPSPENGMAVIEAYDEWAVMVGAPVLELNGRPISLEDLRALNQKAASG